MIKRIIRRLRPARKPVVINKLLELKKNGNLVSQHNSDIDSLNIYFYELDNGYPNVSVGAECFLENNITIYQRNSKVKIGDRVYLGPNTNLNCYSEIEIGDDVMFAWGCTVMDTNAHALTWMHRVNDVIDWKKGWQAKDWSNVESKKIKIGNKCWIGFNSIILKGVELGEGCVVAAGSVVTKSFSPYSVIGGNPAVFIKETE